MGTDFVTVTETVTPVCTLRGADVAGPFGGVVLTGVNGVVAVVDSDLAEAVFLTAVLGNELAVGGAVISYTPAGVVVW
jgi:hypothetical protein